MFIGGKGERIFFEKPQNENFFCENVEQEQKHVNKQGINNL